MGFRRSVGELLARAARRLGVEGVGDRRSRAREETQAQLEEAQWIAGVGSWEWHIPSGRNVWSDEIYRMLGYEPQTFTPTFERYLQAVHPEDREKAEAITRRAIEDLEPFKYECRIVCPDGEVRIVEARGRVFTDDQGVAYRVAGTEQDITERKAIEAELVHRDQLAEAQRIAQVGSWEWDVPADRITWSDELFRMFGLEPQSFVPDLQRFMDLVHPEDRERVQGVVVRAMEDLQPFSYEMRIVRPDGTVRHCHARGNVFADSAGSASRMAGTVQDITARKAIEEELVRARDEADTARVVAEEASRAKGEFLANMSHELRTPLNSVIGFANVLLKNKAGNLRDSDLQYLERIQANGEHLLELINDVLDLSKIEVGKMEAEIEPVSLAELVEETLDEMTGTARGEAVELRAVLPDDLAPIATDPGKLKQILINLVGNAVKFTEEGEVTVEVHADAATHRPERIEVRDTGLGIPEERLAAIFEAFEQAETGTARRFGGTGLGLTIVASLSELLGFRVEVESETGVGSTFRLVLPADRAERTDLEPDGRRIRGAGPFRATRPTGEPELDGKLVLVIDDETDSRILLTHHLEDSGARTITASTGEQGLRMAREFQPDLITLDLLLPGMKGWEILPTLKSDPELADIPVIVVSVVAHEDRGSVLGAAEVIDKPVHHDELLAALRRTLGQQPAAHPSSSPPSS